MKFCLSLIISLLPAMMFGQEIVLADNSGRAPNAYFSEATQSLGDGNTRQAVQQFEKLIRFCEENGRQSELAENYFAMALAFALNGNYSKSIRYHKKALRAHRKYISDEPAQEILINLGLTYQLAGRNHKARKYLN